MAGASRDVDVMGVRMSQAQVEQVVCAATEVPEECWAGDSVPAGRRRMRTGCSRKFSGSPGGGEFDRKRARRTR